MAVSTSFSECIPRELSEPIRQGDVFRWVDDVSSNPWRRFGVIITADCDVAHEKHRGILSYCPILTFLDFLGLFWIPDLMARGIEKHQRNLFQLISRFRKKYRPEFSQNPDPSLISGWVERRGAEGVAEDLSVPPGPQRADLVERLEILKSLGDLNVSGSFSGQLRALARLKCGESSPEPEAVQDATEQIWNGLVGRIGRLPGDLFFLNSIGVGFSDGYMVYVRRIREIQVEAIAITPAQERSGEGVSAARISLLGAPYRYRLTQQLGAVFSDIGLPQEYQVNAKTTLQSTREAFGLGERKDSP